MQTGCSTATRPFAGTMTVPPVFLRFRLFAVRLPTCTSPRNYDKGSAKQMLRHSMSRTIDSNRYKLIMSANNII